MAQLTAEVATETVEAVEFSVMTDEEVKKLSVRNITNTNLLNMVGRPESGGLYDPALGPFDDHSLCKTCGQRSHCCPGHCGHIDLVSLVYHPLLFNMLYRILQNTCLSCYHFRASREEVKMCISKLNLIMEGDVIGARGLDSDLSEHPDYCVNSHQSGGFSDCFKHKDQHDWTSFQLTEAHSVLHLFLTKRSKKCFCGAKNPPITKPMFAWLHKDPLNESDIKSNVIKGYKLDGPLSEEDDEKSISEVENATDHGDELVTTKRQIKKKDAIQMEFLKWKKSRSLLPTEVREIFRLLWDNEPLLCSFICDIHQLHPFQKKAGYMMFFLKTLLVPPIKFRPPARTGVAVMEHPQTVLLGKVLESNLSLANAYEQCAEHSLIVRLWMNLQQSVNILFDSKSATGVGQRDASGICQLLEKKEGIFRQKMMGKRVNFACRSVISPDPYLAVNEIGIPPVFALKLTYPERVTPWNVTSLRNAIVNGPEIHPGATHYVDKTATVKLPTTRKSRIAFSRKLPSSRGVTTQPGKILGNDYEGKVVQRHLRNGDIVLVNRQPTLHKPSIIALKVRVLPGERTIRFHYANCDSFNADFDGDEINVHFPQDEISRAEAYNIVNADNQYIVPTRGDPKRALIQDHIVAAVLLTKRDTFFTLQDFNELLYMSGICSSGASSLNNKIGKKISVVDSETFIQAHPPVIVKPQRLWTGKQVITAILNHITRGSLPFTVKKRAKIAREYFGRDESKKNDGRSKTVEEFSQNKNSRGAKKISAGNVASNTNKGFEEKAAGGMGRIKGNYSHSIDEDIVFVYKNELVQGIIDKEQFGKYGLVHTVQELYGSNAAGKLLSVLSRVLTSFLQMHGFSCGVHDLLLQHSYDKQRNKLLQVSLNCGEDVHQQFIGHGKEHLDSSEMQIEVEKAIRRNGESAVALLDGMMRSKLNTLNSAVTKLFPEGLIKPFRKNCLSLMTLSGAKGGTFNFQQISLLLGQQELEGKRVPRMVSGKTLPCFIPWDSSARAGGFISDRYLTGLRPQEFYFHCMAGREGLVDTAVKTSRSGYLQRCLIKNLECLSVHYDYTIRDADGSIIQFRYGEDGVDIHKKNYLQEFEALALNEKLIVSNDPLSQIDDVCVSKYVEEDNEVPNRLAKEAKDFLENYAIAMNHGRVRSKDLSNFLKLVKNKYYMSLAQPGEPVGIIAAQSIGEPSTQMTLNTFHHAGRGEMNVTLGIPRLQEILMTASVSIKTPTMTCPLLKFKTKDDAEQLASKLKRITVADLIENMEVSLVPFAIVKNEICSVYKLKIKLYDPKLYPPHTDITLEDCHNTLQKKYLDEMEAAIEKHLLLLSRIAGIKSEIQPKKSDEMDGDGSESKSQMGDDDDDDDDDGNEEGADDMGSQKKKRQSGDEVEYDDESDEEAEEGTPLSKPENEVELNENDDEEAEEGLPLAETDNEVEMNEDDDEEAQEGLSLSELENDDGRGAGGEDKTKDSLKTPSGHGVQEQKAKSVVRRKKEDKYKIYVSCDGLCFEVHFKLNNQPHILLAQIAEKAAKKVYVKSAGKIEQCKVVELHLDDSNKGGIPMLRKGKETRLALQTAGVDFAAFWNMQDELDVRFISSNDINAMLNTYGVEAARATIMAEVFTVFGHYGVTVDMRHLSLIADYMTQTGGYRPMSRSGGISGSISPLAKMSYETASKFLTQAATHGEVDNLETPSARICLGLPAKVGTGCFDLMHDLDV